LTEKVLHNIKLFDPKWHYKNPTVTPSTGRQIQAVQNIAFLDQYRNLSLKRYKIGSQFYVSLIGNHRYPTEPHQFLWSWVTLATPDGLNFWVYRLCVCSYRLT